MFGACSVDFLYKSLAEQGRVRPDDGVIGNKPLLLFVFFSAGVKFATLSRSTALAGKRGRQASEVSLGNGGATSNRGDLGGRQ